MTTQLIQGTEEWLAWRHTGIGASEAPVIMGVSPYKTPKELWQQKINPTPPPQDDSKKFIFEKGHRLEEIARKNYELQTFADWQPKLLEHSQQKRFRASLDGWNDDKKAVWECKYMGAEKYASLQNKELDTIGRIPVEYFPQLMHQVMVTGAEEIHFTGIIDNKVDKNLGKHETEQYTLSFKVTKDHLLYIEEKLIPKLVDFMDAVDTKREPSLSADDTVITKDTDLGKLLTKYKSVKTKLDKLAKDEKEMKKQIFEITLKLHNRVQCKGHKISQTISADKTVVDYEAFAKSITTEEDMIKNCFTKTVKGRKTQKITINKGSKK